MRNLIFAGLLALQIVLSACEQPKVIQLEPGYRLDLEGKPEPKGKLLNCTIEKRGEKFYSLYPENEGPGEYNGDKEYCAYTVWDVEISWAGLWTLTTITDEETIRTDFKIRMTREVGVKPANNIVGAEGQYITVELDANDTDVRSCIVTLPGYERHDIMKEQVKDVQALDDSCGIRIRANKAFEGQWEFHSDVGEYLTNHAMFHTSVPYGIEASAQDEIKVMKATWILGKKEEKVDLYSLGALFCQLTKPDGEKMPITFGNCELKVSVANPFHEGTWRVTYAKPGLMKLQYMDIVIKIKDLSTLETSYSYGTDEEINILCRTGNPYMKFCTFIRPDKYIINLPVGVGNENYSYYGSGYENRYPDSDRDFGECGVTIHKPSHADFGIWTCEMGTSGGKVQGAVINVENIRAGETDRANKADNSPILVKRGDSFKINCKASSTLNYCWLSSPNGTTFTVSTDGGSDKTLTYDGKGFSMGECGAIFARSNTTDHGEWTCHMGLNGGFEVEQKVSVKISETYLIAKEETVHAGEKTQLTCRTLDSAESSLQYCRWVRPNGQGINKMDAARYQLTQGIKQCSLTISTVLSEDVGKWRCFGALSRADRQEEWATVELKSKVLDEAKLAGILSIVLGTALLVVTLLGVAFAVLFFYKRRNARAMKNPPPYYAQNYAMPDDVRTDVDPIPEKIDYKY